MPKKREPISAPTVEYKLVKPGTVLIKGEEKLAHKVALTGTFCQCTNCNGIKPFSHFGFRLEKGVIRNQPQCSSCR